MQINFRGKGYGVRDVGKKATGDRRQARRRALRRNKNKT